MKKLFKWIFLLLLTISTYGTIVSCGDNDEDDEIRTVDNTNGGENGGTGGSGGKGNNNTTDLNAVRQLLLGTWKCNEDDGYTVITFKEDGISDWKYLFEGEITRWTSTYELTAQYIMFDNDESNKYEYTLTENTLSFDGDDYVKIENYIDEDDPSGTEESEEEKYDNRGAVAKQFRGNGTKTNPYIISDVTELRKLADDVEEGKTYRDEYFKMTADIVINRSIPLSMGKISGDVSKLEQWKPIGKGLTPFCGTFDGNGHSISGIFIQKENKDTLGLFGYFSGSLTNLTLKDSYIEGGQYVGAFVGFAIDTQYSKTYKPSFEQCINYGIVAGGNDESNNQHGGIVGYIRLGKVQKCINYGYITGYNNIGGLVGRLIGTDMKDCANYYTVEGYRSVAGICGRKAYYQHDGSKTYSTLVNCYNFGEIKGDRYLGGIIGSTSKTNSTSGRVTNIVNYGKVVGNAEGKYLGALIGNLVTGASLSNGYFLETSYPVGLGNVSGTPSNIQSMTSNQMQDQSFLTTLNKNAKALGSSYSQWKIGIDGFPILEWVIEP